MEKITVKQILEVLNNHQYEQLGEYLSDVNWLDIDSSTILPQQAIHSFAKSIVDKEVRLDVMRFLEVYAENYFQSGAEEIVRDKYRQRHIGVSSQIVRTEAKQYIDTFKKELNTQIHQLQTSDEYSGEKYSKQEKKIKELEQQIQDLQKRNTALQAQLDKYKNPMRHGKYIPEELDTEAFYSIMSHLADKKIVRTVTAPNVMGIRCVVCYQWDASKALFGYFIEKMNGVLKLRGARVPINWKVFRPAINNYEEIIDEARKALSTYNNSTILQKNRIEKAEIIDEAMPYKEEPL